MEPDRASPGRTRVVLCREEGIYVAQCLEYDIAAHGATVAAAREAFIDAWIRHVMVAMERGVRPFDGLPEGPREYWRLWDESCGSGGEPQVLRVPRFRLRRREGGGEEQPTGAAEISALDVTGCAA